MNNERRKALLTLIVTLIIGISIGMLAPGLFHKVKDRGRFDRDGKGRGHENKKAWFVETIYRIVRPDSTQSAQVKPITAWASRQIDSLEVSSNARLAVVLDSVKLKLKPIITEEQFKRLDEFDTRAKGHWRGDRH